MKFYTLFFYTLLPFQKKLQEEELKNDVKASTMIEGDFYSDPEFWEFINKSE